MRHLATAALTLLFAMAQLGAQDVPRAGESQWGPQERPVGTPPDKAPKSTVPFPAKFRVKNVPMDESNPRSPGCCGWASLKSLLLQAGYDKQAESLDIHRGGVGNSGNRSQLSDWLDGQGIEYDSSASHDWEFLKSHLPCLVFFNCANSNYGYCEEDCEGIFDRARRRPWIRPGGRMNAGHVAVIAGVDDTSIYMVANRPANYSEENYQQIDRADFDSRWYGYCLCLRKRHRQPQVQPPAPSPAVPEPVAPAPAAPPNIVIQISQVLDAKLDPLVKRIEVLEKKQQVMEEKIRVIHLPPAK